MEFELSECFDCGQLYWTELNRRCPICGSAYIVVETELDFDISDSHE